MNDNKTDKRIYTMSEEKPRKAVIKMGVPVTMGMLFMVVYNLVDTFFVGLLHNDYQLAATNLSYPIMMITVALAGIVANGAASYIARSIGAGKMENANATLTIGIAMIVAISIVLTTVGTIFLKPLVYLLGAKENTYLFTKYYVGILLIGSIFTMANFTLGQLLRSEGSTTYSMIGMIAGTIGNIVLDPVFIFLFGLEIKGAAIATVIGNGIGTFICLYFYISKKTLLSPEKKLLKWDGKIIKEIFWVGIPNTLEQILTTVAMVVLNNLSAVHGELTVTAMGISSKLMSFGNYVYQGFSAGCQPLMGYNYGAKNYNRMKKIMIAGIEVTSTIEIVIMILLGIFAPNLIRIFSQTPEVVSIGSKALRAAILILPFVGSTALSRTTFNSMGKPQYSLIITSIRQVFLYIPLLLVFDKLWGFEGLIYAQPVAEVFIMIFSVMLLLNTLKKLSLALK